jgi:chromosome segregation ATPase
VIATVRSAGSIKDAVLAADPAIQDIAANLDKDFETISKKIESRAVLDAAKVFIQERYEKERGVSKAYRNALVKRFQDLQNEIVQAQNAVPPNNSSMTALLSIVAQLEPRIQGANEQLDARAREDEAVERNWEAGQALFAGARKGFRRWAAIHRQLATGLQSGAPPNVALLVGTVQDLRAILDEARKK